MCREARGKEFLLRTPSWEAFSSGRPDLNRGPHRPERCALPGCATPREDSIIPDWGSGGGNAVPLLWAGERFHSMTMVRGLISTILAVLALAAMPTAAPAYLPPGFIGISPQSASSAKDYELRREADIRSVRLPLFWGAVEPESPAFSERQWAGFDHEVRLAAKAGVTIFPVVTGTPKWVAPLGIDLPVATARQRRAWASFVRATVERYGPGGAFWREEDELPYFPIRRWEIWNEENLVTFATRPEPAKFAR